MKNYFIGIDVSKEKLDICLHMNNEFASEIVINNNTQSIRDLLKSLSKEHEIEVSQILVCAEYTGQYTSVLRDMFIK